MEAEFTGQDYLLFLDKGKGELIRVKEIRLEAKLTEPFRGADLSKVVTLEYGENNGPDEIELEYLPKQARNWDEIKEVKVTRTTNTVQVLPDAT